MKNTITMFIFLLTISFLWSTTCFARPSDSGSEVVAIGAISNDSSFGTFNLYMHPDSSQGVVVKQFWENNKVGAYYLYLTQGDRFPVTVDVVYEDLSSESIVEKQCQIVVIAHDNGLVEMNVRQLPSFVHCAVDASNNIVLTDNFTKKLERK